MTAFTDREPDQVPCPCCGTMFTPRKIGAHVRKFCSPGCKRAFETAARAYATKMVEAGLLTFDAMQAAISGRGARKQSGGGSTTAQHASPAHSVARDAKTAMTGQSRTPGYVNQRAAVLILACAKDTE